MKVVLLTPFYRPDNYGGAVKVYESLCREQEFETHIICPVSNKNYDDSAYFYETNIRIHRCSEVQFSYSSRAIFQRVKEFICYKKRVRSEINTLLNEIKPDVIINGGIRWFSWMTSDFIEFAPVINYIHGEELSIKPVGLFGYWLLKTQNSSFSKVNLNLCVSSYTSKKVKEISKKSIVSILTNFVDTSVYYPSSDKHLLKQKYKLQNKISLVCICRLIERKGVDDLLQALNSLKLKGYDNIVLNICGSGPELNNLKLLSEKLSLLDSVTFHGFTEEEKMIELLQASDIFIMPNKTVDGDLEGFGLVFLEASACGLPVIGGKSGGVVDAIEDGYSGFLIEPGSIVDIVDRLHSLIEDTSSIEKIGGNGLNRAKSNFTLSHKRNEFRSIILNTLDGSKID